MKTYPAQQVTAALNDAMDNIARAVELAMVGVASSAARDLRYEVEVIERHVAVLLGQVARLAHMSEKVEEQQIVVTEPTPTPPPATTPSPAQKPFATLYAELVRENEVEELADAGITIEEETAEQIHKMLVDPLCEHLSVWSERDDPLMLPFIEHLGGMDYCAAVVEWKLEQRKVEESNRRKKPENRKPLPKAPALPAGGKA